MKKENSREKQIRETKEKAYGRELEKIRLEQEYIKNKMNGNYYLARYNMIAEQLHKNEIKELIDGCVKTEDLMFGEMFLMKMNAMNHMRTAHFTKQELLTTFSVKEEEIKSLEDDYYKGNVIRKDYDKKYKKRNKAEFVNSDKD